MEGKDIVKGYVRYLKLQRNMSGNTLDAYQRDLQKLLDYLKHEEKDIREVTLEDLEHFSAGLHDIGIGARSQCRILSGVRSFFRFLQLDGYREDDPTELLESPQIGEHLPEVLSPEEIDLLEASIDLSKWEGHRNRAIIEVLFSCGLRVSELVNLKLSNLYLNEEFVRVIGKGSKERLVPISQKAIRELSFWFDDRQHMEIKPGEEDYVFLNRRGAHLTRVMILIMIKRQAEVAGIKKTRRCRPEGDSGPFRSREYRHDGNLHPHRHIDAPSRNTGTPSKKHEEVKIFTFHYSLFTFYLYLCSQINNNQTI